MELDFEEEAAIIEFERVVGADTELPFVVLTGEDEEPNEGKSSWELGEKVFALESNNLLLLFVDFVVEVEVVVVEGWIERFSIKGLVELDLGTKGCAEGVKLGAFGVKFELEVEVEVEVVEGGRP